VLWFGKKDSFERLARLELPVLYRVARRMGASPDEAEDLVQTTLLKAYQAWDRFDGRHLRSWLIRILRNERLMNMRGPQIQVDSLDAPDAYEPSEEPFWEEVSWRMEAGRILEELEQLPENFRLAIQLCDVEQMTYEEAAAALDIPIGTIRSRLFRARALLRQRLAPISGKLEGAVSS
jgi:RNA polymerase sigma-70 factor (ECF subfamily)